MTPSLTRSRAPRMTTRPGPGYWRAIGLRAAAEDTAREEARARVALEAGMTPELAAEMAAGHPELAPLAEAMERLAGAQ